MAKKMRWDELSDGQKAGLLVLAAMQIGLLVAALWDLAHRSADEVRGDRRMWAGLVFINWIGPLAYFTVGRKGFVTRLADRCSCCGSRSREPQGDETV